ncbi:hypothetical protein CEXT_402981 [Caerostris extrusa]|uniref:Uncharacterized protein n=1 Tax=Caerostris extrusa TaxID=172846 RepID=A0AAV4UJ16_CAEEX|nr:hypothetical protein CEXT_402981 [Caerostris extrusa]
MEGPTCGTEDTTIRQLTQYDDFGSVQGCPKISQLKLYTNVPKNNLFAVLIKYDSKYFCWAWHQIHDCIWRWNCSPKDWESYFSWGEKLPLNPWKVKPSNVQLGGGKVSTT